MPAAELSEVEEVLGYRFATPALLEQALTHGSLRHEFQTAHAGGSVAFGIPLPASLADNERLEFLGDAIVGLVVAEDLYRRYPELEEGSLTRMRAALVSRKHLGQVGTTLALGRYLRLAKAEERNGGRRKPVLLANCVEALVAAIYLDGGFQAAAAFITTRVSAPYINALREELEENSAIGDFKSALQELLQARGAPQPEYVLQAESGPDHRKRFVVEVRVQPGKQAAPVDARAEESTKKKAEQEAARKIYEQLKAHRVTAAVPAPAESYSPAPAPAAAEVGRLRENVAGHPGSDPHAAAVVEAGPARATRSGARQGRAEARP